MSTYWRLRCTEHGDSQDEGVNHGEGELRAIAALREPYNVLCDADPEGVLEVTTFYAGPGRTALWLLRAHRTCVLELVSEYGDIEPVDKRCEAQSLPVAASPTAAAEAAQCDRQAGHGGRHSAEIERFRARLEWA
jgi:hypothetical protein